MANAVEKLVYFVTGKKNVMVISLFGSIDRNIDHIFNECLTQIKNSEANCIVLNFQGVTDFMHSGVAPLVRFEKAVREKPASLRLCFLSPSLKRFLTDEGIVRPDEIIDNLVHALHSFSDFEDRRNAA